MVDTNPEVLRLAREIAAQDADDRDAPLTAKMIRAGECDAISVRVAIAAIERTKDLSVQFLRTDDGLETIAAFERYDHLRQSEKDNSDAAS